MGSIERIPVCSQVVAGIQSLIAERGLRPGDRIPTERELCERFGVGRSTVREAMRLLQASGVLSLQQGRGAFVNDGQVDPSVAVKPWFPPENGVKLRDFVEIRLAIEPLGIRLAIERASEEEIAEIARVHSLFIQTVPKRDPEQLAHFDEQFHLEIAKATHNTLIVSIQEAIKKEVFEMRVQSYSVPERMAGAIAPHNRILNAFYARDTAEGEEAMVQHLTEAFQEILA